MRGYQIYSSSWSNGYGRIPDRLLFGGKVFRTVADAEAAWDDTAPGRNDHMVTVPCGRIHEYGPIKG